MLTQEQDFRCGFVALAGVPNVGKSTLMNRVLGQKISIATSRPQTTRNRILGVHTLANQGQIIFVDTPGLHKPHKELNAVMVDNALRSIQGTDLILFVIDATSGLRQDEHGAWHLSAPDAAVAEQIAQMEPPVLVVINKLDKLRDRGQLLPMMEFAHQGIEGITPQAVIPTSAQEGEGVDNLLEEILKGLPQGDALYPEDMLTDQAERFIAAEIVREKLTLQTRKEIPYSSAVMVESFQEDRRRGLLKLRAVIYVERNSQKGIIIGKGGQRLKQIGSQARSELERFFGRKVFLEIHVKVEREWATDPHALRRLGYRREE
jgi:GTP-binding protein Era